MLCALMIVAIAFSTTVSPAQADTSCEAGIRYEAHSPCGQHNLESLEYALEIMKKMDCTDPLSWYYQGAIHWVPTADDDIVDNDEILDDNKISGIKDSNPLCPYYSQFRLAATKCTKDNYQDEECRKDTDREKLLASWDNCTHARNQAGQSSKIHFLPWHRLYVYHFEKIVRQLSGNQDFGLPYWGYISLEDQQLPNNTFLTMPEEFRDDGSSLYEEARYSRLKAGDPIQEDFGEESLLNSVEDLRRQTNYAKFSIIINNGPHGAMHDYVGGLCLSLKLDDKKKKKNCDTEIGEKFYNPIYNRKDSGLMAEIPSAGFDPIFWMHHGNIDRLWAEWTNETNVKVTEEQLEKVSWPYQFFEPDGSTKGYTMKDVVEAIYNPDYLQYRYAEPDGGYLSVLPPLLMTERVVPKKSRILLGDRQIQATIDEVVTQVVPLKRNLRSQLLNRLRAVRSAAPDAVRLTQFSEPNYLLEVEVTYTGRPRGNYEVYLNLPDDEAARQTAMTDIDTYFVGGMSFFVLDSDRPRTKTFLFDITDELLEQYDELLEQYENSDELKINAPSISIVKQGGPADETLEVSSLAIYVQEVQE